MINTAISAYYYLRLIIVMFFRERSTAWTAPRIPASAAVALVLTILGVFYLGLFPGRVINALQSKPVVSLSSEMAISITRLTTNVTSYNVLL